MMKNERFNSISKSKSRLKLGYFLLISFIILLLLKPNKTESEINLIVSKCKTPFLSQKL